MLACILAFAAGSLISALAIDLAFKGAMDLYHHGYKPGAAWVFFVASGFALGAIVCFITSLYLESAKGATIKRPMRFKEYALALKHEQAKELVSLLSGCDLLRHLPAGGYRTYFTKSAATAVASRRDIVSCWRPFQCAVHYCPGTGRGCCRFISGQMPGTLVQYLLPNWVPDRHLVKWG